DYSLWEFFYDPRKDQMRAAGAAALQTGAPANGIQSTNSGFGSSSSFGSNSSMAAPQNPAPQNPSDGATAAPQSPAPQNPGEAPVASPRATPQAQQPPE